MRVTAQMLRDRNACEDQVAIFEREWPDGVNVGIRAARKAVKLGLDLEWFAETFLPPAAWADYEKAIAPAWLITRRRQQRRGLSTGRRQQRQWLSTGRRQRRRGLSMTRRQQRRGLSMTRRKRRRWWQPSPRRREVRSERTRYQCVDRRRAGDSGLRPARARCCTRSIQALYGRPRLLD